MAFDYTDSDIRAELACLGYEDITENQLREFKKQLIRLMQTDKSKEVSQKHVADLPESCERTPVEAVPRCAVPTPRYTYPHKEGWASSAASDSWLCPRPLNEFSGKPSAESMIGDSAKHYQVPNNQRYFTNSLSMTHVQPDPCLKPTKVDWRSLREGHFSSTAGNATQGSYGCRERSGYFDEQAFWARMNRRYRRQEVTEDMCQLAPPNEPRNKKKNAIKNISGIISHKEHPHTRNLYRTKPFERHQMYLRAWRTQPPVGEACRNSVIWQVHKRLLKKEEIQFRQKTLTPNMYVVPTTKPRYELRWAVRQCNENYEKPPCGSFHRV